MNDVICACFINIYILHILCIDFNCVCDNSFSGDNESIQINREDGQGNEALSNKLIRDALRDLYNKII